MNIHTKKKTLPWQKFLIGIFVLFLVVAILNVFQEQVINYFYFIISPVQKTFGQAGKNLYDFFMSFIKNKDLKKESNILKEENQRLLSEISILKEYFSDNEILKEALQNTEADNFKIILADTIGLDVYNDFILINKGLDDGILENMPVISKQKVLYGKVYKSYKNYSKIMLISAKNSVLNVKINPDKSDPQSEGAINAVPIYGVLKGNGNLSVYLDLVPSESEINEGDILITSALEGTFPKELLVGKIIEKNKNDLKPFQTAKIKPFFDVKTIDDLFVITNYLQAK